MVAAARKPCILPCRRHPALGSVYGRRVEPRRRRRWHWGRPMSWQAELDELRARERMAREMGGPDKVQRQHEGGRLTVRERIDRLIDQHSFHEIGTIAGKAEYDADGRLIKLTPANCVMGRARIDGRPVIVLGDDFTVRGGSADAT